MKSKILIPIVLAIVIVGLIVIVNVTGKPEYNDDMVVGNTPGNLMNGGYFCENGDTIYFANMNDYEKLYSMDLDCSDFKRLGKTTVSEINCAGKYIYYVAQNNKYKDAENTSGAGAVLSSGGVGLFRCNRKGNHQKNIYDKPVAQAALAGNYLYYQHYDKKKGLFLYKAKIDEREGKCLFKTNISPVGVYNGSLYYYGTQKDHNIYKMSLLDNSYDRVYEGNCTSVIVFQNKIYFIDLDNNYALTSLNLDGTDPKVIVNDRVLTYNFSLNGNFLYYQIDKQEDSRICQMDMETGESHPLLNGNFCNINTTSNYVFFREFDTDNVYVVKDEKSPKLNMFDPPVKK